MYSQDMTGRYVVHPEDISSLIQTKRGESGRRRRNYS